MEDRLRILRLIEAGEISVEEGARRLEAGGGTSAASERPASAGARPAWVRWAWQAVFWTGVGLMVGGGLLVSAAFARELASGWRVLGWVLLASGVLWTMLGWWLRRAPWLSLRVRQSDGPTIALGLPVPLGLAAWGVRVARPFVPRLAETGIEEMILALEDEMYEGGPILVEVDEGVGGERVHVCLG